MTKFCDLKRRFRDLTDAEMDGGDPFDDPDDYEYASHVGWAELLTEERVILLAEAGAGKTTEMHEQANRLVEQGRFAFFLPLESLDRDRVVDLLSVGDEQRFEEWKSDGDTTAWFFLDAVDELKLTGGKLDRALLRLSRCIDAHIGRARIIISSRPSDWRSSRDLALLRNRLPIPASDDDARSQSADEVFIQALRNYHGATRSAQTQGNRRTRESVVRTVAMLGMNNRQIEQFAAHSGVEDTASFISEVSQQNARIFARRPLDLADLIGTWRITGRLGTRADQHENSVWSKSKDDPSRPDYNELADSQARQGAERLALALTLTRTRTIRSPELALHASSEDSVLDIAEILPEWTEAQRQTLLRRALFDPATYGRIRFHHRSVQEFLAARRLRALRQEGMSATALRRLLFAQSYGVDVVVPSMRPIAAWLSLWDDAVCAELIKREPETLLALGDPGSLDLNVRARLVREFAAKYRHGGWRGLNIPVNEVRRLAHPELGSAVRECWGIGAENDDVRALLIEMIWLGPINSCADLAHAVAVDQTRGAYERITAVRALLACGRNSSVRKLAEQMLPTATSWPDRVVLGIAAELFPDILTVDELVMLMERISEPKRTVGGFDWELRKIVEVIDPCSQEAVSLRDKVAQLIWRGCDLSESHYSIRSKYDHVIPALATLCDKQLSEALHDQRVDLIRACVIASRLGGGATHKQVTKLRSRIREEAELRGDAFWAELAFMDRIKPESDPWMRFHRACQDGLIDHFTEADRFWLEDALADETRPERRPVALHALIYLWRERGRVSSDLNDIRKMIRGNATLGQILQDQTAPPRQDKKFDEMEKRHKQRQRTQAEAEEQRLEDWKKWRDALISNPAGAFSPENLNQTVSNLYYWLRASTQNQSSSDVWDKDALKKVFSPDVADRAEKTFREYWRSTRPVLWTARTAEFKNNTPHEWVYGLMGVSSEAEMPGWVRSLSSDDARAVAAYATIEINGFPPFIVDMAERHGKEVTEVIGTEITR